MRCRCMIRGGGIGAQATRSTTLGRPCRNKTFARATLFGRSARQGAAQTKPAAYRDSSSTRLASAHRSVESPRRGVALGSEVAERAVSPAPHERRWCPPR